MHRTVVCHDESNWISTPADHGGDGFAWQWGNELLVEFSVGQFAPYRPIHQGMARSGRFSSLPAT